MRLGGGELEGAWEWERLQAHAKTSPTGDYEGLFAELAHIGAVGKKLQGVLTKELELVKHDELVVELTKLHVHDRRCETHRAPRGLREYIARPECG
jgi:hypothetical protein